MSPLNTLADRLAPDMEAVNALILAHLGSDVPMAQTIAQGLITAGGKRIRPLLTLAFGKIMGADDDKVRQMAAAVEFIHSATLLHDDVVDESDLRRGNPSANATFGNAAPVLVGDFLFARAFQMMVQPGNLSALELLARTAGDIAQGEVLQLSVKNNLDSGIDTYFKIIEAKTAVLFAASTEVAAILADKPREAARAYGLHLGMAFQIMDDVLDYAAQKPALGKNIGDDFHEGKMTLPVWLALAEGDAREQAFWMRTMGEHIQTGDDLEQALAILRKHYAFAQAHNVAQIHAQKAQQALGNLSSSEFTPILSELLDFVLTREY